MIEFKKQTNRITKEDKAININLFLKDFEFSVITSKYWGDFSEKRENNPLIEIKLDGYNYKIELIELKRILRKGLK